MRSDVFSLSGCGANFTAPSGRVVSPNYPANYPDHSNCNYTIDAGEQSVVVLTFQVFQVEGKYEQHTERTADVLSLFNINSKWTFGLIVKQL